jgi:hypothetical protein
MFYMWLKIKKNCKYDKIIFEIYLKNLIIKNNLNWIFMNNLLLVLLFSYQLHNN